MGDIKKTKKVAGVKKPVKVKIAVEAVAEPVVEVPVEVAPVATVPVNAPVDLSRIVFEGAKVVAVLTTKHTPTHFHCRMSDGTQKHVPKSLFE